MFQRNIGGTKFGLFQLFIANVASVDSTVSAVETAVKLR
jgi:hypothetical protein